MATIGFRQLLSVLHPDSGATEPIYDTKYFASLLYFYNHYRFMPL